MADAVDDDDDGDDGDDDDDGMFVVSVAVVVDLVVVGIAVNTCSRLCMNCIEERFPKTLCFKCGKPIEEGFGQTPVAANLRGGAVPMS